MFITIAQGGASVEQISIFPALFGNERLKSILGADIRDGHCAHAFILEAPAGSGKRTAAKVIAAALQCENRQSSHFPCGNCLPCRKIEKGISPDFIRITSEDKATISVDAIRAMRETLYIPPNDTEHKVYVIEDAEKMTVQAQNALLLSLEEPPPFVMFLLLTTDAGALLPTIRSRAPVMRMQLFPADAVLAYVRDHLPEGIRRPTEEELRAAASLSGGAIGRAFDLLRGDESVRSMEDDRRLAEAVTRQLAAGNPVDGVRLVVGAPKKREDAVRTLRLALSAMRDLLAIKKADDAGLLFYADSEDARELSRRMTPAKILAATDALSAAIRELDGNASVNLVFTTLLLAGSSRGQSC